MNSESHPTDAPRHRGAPPPLYVGVLVALVLMTLLLVWSAQYDLGVANVAIALTLATVQAVLVALVYMHLMYQRALHSVVLVLTLFMLGLFISLAVLDAGQYRDQLEPQLAPELEGR